MKNAAAFQAHTASFPIVKLNYWFAGEKLAGWTSGFCDPKNDPTGGRLAAGLLLAVRSTA